MGDQSGAGVTGREEEEVEREKERKREQSNFKPGLPFLYSCVCMWKKGCRRERMEAERERERERESLLLLLSLNRELDVPLRFLRTRSRECFTWRE